MKVPHIPVLLNEVLESFLGVNEGYFVDCTLGYAGHSSAILEQFKTLKHIGIDRDDEALNFSKQKLHAFEGRSELYKGDFSKVYPALMQTGINAVLADFGVSSLQLDKHERGFSFNSEVLDMRMDQSAKLTAYDVVNTYTHEQLLYILETYGEIKSAKKLVDAIVLERSNAPITSAKALSQITINTLGNYGKIHPATLLFQAIRIEVNSELQEIEELLDALEQKHDEGMIVSLITFHSLEDRLVKERFKKWSKSCICSADAFRCECGNNHALGKMLHRKPVVASSSEIKQNPRSRSAKLRSFKFMRKQL